MAFTKILPAGISTTGLVTVDSLSVGDVTLTGDTDNLIINTDTVTVRPTLDLNFARDKRLDSKITFTRNSTGTYVDANGLIQTAVNNIPRFDHDPITGESLGLLIEESRTNYHGNTGYDTNVGRYGNSPGSTSNTTSPTGENDATIPVPDSNADRYEAYLTVNDTVAGEKWTFTWHEKNINFSGTEPVADIKGEVNLINTTSPTLVATYPNGWKRWSVTAEVQTTGAEARFRYYFGNRIGVGNNNIAAFWGHQSEKGSFPTSYIRGNGVTVTRAADIASITGTNFTDFYNNTEGTAFVNALMPNHNGSSGIPAYAFKSTTDSNRYYGFSRDITAPYHYINTTDLNTYTYGFFASEYKSILTIKENDLNSYINGVQNVNSTSVTLFVPDILYLGNIAINNANILNGHIKSFKYYPKRLSNAQLQNLTK